MAGRGSESARWEEGGIRFLKGVDPASSTREDLIWIPCGTCIGCRLMKGRFWALRNFLELADCPGESYFLTLTYDPDHVPVTLSRRHLSDFLKRIRWHAGALRFFASGEYGDKRGRPHYHMLVYLSSSIPRHLPSFRSRVADSWRNGYVQFGSVTPERVAYCSGYTTKKASCFSEPKGERLDVVTGELYDYQPPFLQMSRRPGIGGAARRFVSSWRDHAVMNGQPTAVPRYLHQAWRDLASADDLLKLEAERAALQRPSRAQLNAGAAIAEARLKLSSAGRVL